MIALLKFNTSTFLGVILTTISLFLLPPTQGGVTKIDPEFKKKIDSAPEGSSWTVIIEFKKDQKVFDSIYEYVENLKPPPGEKGMKAYESMTRLEKYAEETQGKVIQAITKFKKTHPKVRQSTFWITNDRGVWNAPKDLLYLLGEDEFPQFENITNIADNTDIPLEVSEPGHKPPNWNPPPQEETDPMLPLPEVWGIPKINTIRWWRAGYNGSGVIIGHIDTGVDSRHPSLKWNWLGKGPGWLDPTSTEGRTKNTFPYEAVKGISHGTHTIGIAIGRGRKKRKPTELRGEGTKVETEDDVEFYGVGMAPGARWISCLGCPASYCDLTALYECGKFITCPDPKTKCRLVPEIVTISNGFAQSMYKKANKTYPFQPMIKLFKSVGMIPVFSAGNYGDDGCQTIVEPENEEIINVGNVDEDDHLYKTSSKGPPKWRYRDSEITNRSIYKPDLIAPGTNIYSTVFTGKAADFEYGYQTGTSQAAPHVAGAIALLLSRTEFLTFEDVRWILRNYTVPNFALTSSNPLEVCGGRVDRDDPNHKFGWGRIKLPDPDILNNYGFIEQVPSRKMPPPPDYSTLEDDSAPHSVRAGMMGVVMMAGTVLLMNRAVFEI